MSTVRKRLETAGITLPEAPRPVAAYVPAVKAGNLVFVSGQVPMREGSLMATGPVPSAVSPDKAGEAARQCVLNALAVLSDVLDGDLDRVRRIVRVGVFVMSDPGFEGHLTLELSNVANLPIAIYPGMRIGQLSFYELTTPAEAPYGSEAAGSKYQGQRGPTPSRVHKDFG